MVITNLPRSERFKRQNLILVGIISSMIKEPATNTFLEPLVEELLPSWDEGFCFNVHNKQTNPTKFRLELLCVGCDIPACRKHCGFLGKLNCVCLCLIGKTGLIKLQKKFTYSQKLVNLKTFWGINLCGSVENKFLNLSKPIRPKFGQCNFNLKNKDVGCGNY